MINIVDFFEKQFEKWNEERKCGYCWKFEFSQRLSEVNESRQEDDDCCVMVFMVDYNIQKIRSYPASDTGHFVENHLSYNHNFNLLFLIHDDIGTNVHSEIKGHPKEESKWSRILNPLAQCLEDFDACEIIKKPLRYNSETWRVLLDYMDNNYTGWQANYSLTEKIY